ncbi:retrovirus-related pol polyprotein from transposon TNT 1-94 [Tanacetum coccineum]
MAAVNDVPSYLTKREGLRNANHIQTLNLADIYERFVYEANLIQRRYSDTKKALITTPSSTAISTAFFSNNVVLDFPKNSDDEVDERYSEEYLRDLDIEYHERTLLENLKRFIKRNNFFGQKANENTECYKCGNKGHFARDCFSKTSKPSYQSPINNYSSVSKGFQPKFTPKLIQSSPNSSSQVDPKFQKDYKAEYKKMKAKLALLKVSPSSSQNPKTFQPKNKGLVVETFDWDEEEVFDDEEVTQVKVLMALADDELTVGKSHARNGEWVDITIRKCRDELLILKQAKLDAVTFQIQNTKLTKLNYALQEQLKEEKKINEKWLTSSKKVSQCISEQIPHQKKKVVGGELFTESSSKMNENENLFIPTSKGTHHSSTSLEYPSGSFTKLIGNVIDLSTPLSKRETRLRSENYKAQPYKYASPSKQILKARENPFPPCTHYGFNDHRPDDCRNYLNVIHVEAFYTPPLTTMSLITSKERHIKEPIWYLDSGCSMSMTGVKSYLHKYVEQLGPKNGRKLKLCKSQTNHELDSFCDEKGISQEFSSPYTPEQNGVAERKNKTLIEAARTMLNGSVLLD